MPEPQTDPNQQPQGVDPSGQEPNPTPHAQPTEPVTEPTEGPNNPNGEGQEPKPETFDRDYVEKLRKEAATHRTRAKEHEDAVAAAQAEKDDLINKIGRAFGFVKDDEAQQADAGKLVEQVTAERDTLQQELKSLRQENALSKALNSVEIDGQKVQVDPTLTLEVVKGTGALDGLDPASDDYQAQVAQAVVDVVKERPQLRAQVAPRSSGNAPNPTDNAANKLSQDDLARLYAEGKYDEINKAAAEGRIA